MIHVSPRRHSNVDQVARRLNRGGVGKDFIAQRRRGQAKQIGEQAFHDGAQIGRRLAFPRNRGRFTSPVYRMA